ncbi:hypothetical protein ACOSQ3_026568 [Xanthoceras sorbifolium]
MTLFFLLSNTKFFKDTRKPEAFLPIQNILILNGLLSGIPSLLLLQEKKFMAHGSFTSAWHCSVRLLPIAESFPLLPPVGVWAVS